MKIEYFNPQSTMAYIGGLVCILFSLILSTNKKSLIFGIFFGIMLIFFGIMNAKERIKMEKENKLKNDVLVSQEGKKK